MHACVLACAHVEAVEEEVHVRICMLACMHSCTDVEAVEQEVLVQQVLVLFQAVEHSYQRRRPTDTLLWLFMHAEMQCAQCVHVCVCACVHVLACMHACIHMHMYNMHTCLCTVLRGRVRVRVIGLRVRCER